MHTTQLLVLLGGAKLEVELVLRESGVMLRIRWQIAFRRGHSGRIQQGATLDMLKKIGIDWNLTGRFGSIVHLPSDDLRQVLSGDRRRGGDTSRSSRTKTISTLVRIPPMSAPREGIWRLCRDLGKMGKLWT